MTLIWFVVWLVSDLVGDRESLTFDPVNWWTGLLLSVSRSTSADGARPRSASADRTPPRTRGRRARVDGTTTTTPPACGDSARLTEPIPRLWKPPRPRDQTTSRSKSQRLRRAPGRPERRSPPGERRIIRHRALSLIEQVLGAPGERLPQLEHRLEDPKRRLPRGPGLVVGRSGVDGDPPGAVPPRMPARRALQPTRESRRCRPRCETRRSRHAPSNDRDRRATRDGGMLSHRPENRARQRALDPGSRPPGRSTSERPLQQRAGPRRRGSRGARSRPPPVATGSSTSASGDVAASWLNRSSSIPSSEGRAGPSRGRAGSRTRARARLRSPHRRLVSTKRSALAARCGPVHPDRRSRLSPPTFFVRTRAPSESDRPAPARTGARPRHRVAAATRHGDRRSPQELGEERLSRGPTIYRRRPPDRHCARRRRRAPPGGHGEGSSG